MTSPGKKGDRLTMQLKTHGIKRAFIQSKCFINTMNEFVQKEN